MKIYAPTIKGTKQMMTDFNEPLNQPTAEKQRQFEVELKAVIFKTKVYGKNEEEATEVAEKIFDQMSQFEPKGEKSWSVKELMGIKGEQNA